MAATPLQPNSSGATPSRPRLLKSGPAPVSKVRLKGANGQAITPKPSGPALRTAGGAPKPSPEEEASLKAAEEEAARLAQEEYERQMEEYNRQMEEYNRQMEEHNRMLAAQAEEEARLAAEAEKARLEEEARLAAEAEKARQEEEARLAAEAEKARQIAEARRAEEAAMAQVALAQAKAAEAAAQAALLEARAKSAALGITTPAVAAPTPTPAPAAASSRPKLAAKPAGLKPSGIALKPTTAAAGASRPAAGAQPAALKPSGIAKPAATGASRPAVAAEKPAALKPSGIALKPTTAAGSSRPAAGSVSPAALKPSGIAKPAAAPVPESRPAAPKPSGIALKPAAAAGSSRPAAGSVSPAALKPSGMAKPAVAPAVESAPASRPAAQLKPAAPKAGAVAKPAPSGIAKPVAKPAAAKPALPKAAKPAPVPAPAAEPAPVEPEDPNAMNPEGVDAEAEMSEEELAARDAYLAQLQAQAEKPKIWQTPQFKVISIGFGVILAALGVWAYINSERNAAMQEHGKYINKYLKIAQNLNQKGIESLSDVQDKGVAFDCPKAAAQDLLLLVVDPDMKGPGGVSYGPPGKTEGVAQNACLVLAIAAEKDPEIDKLIFKTLGEKCDVMRPALFRWLLQRMTISNNKGIKGKLKKLAKQVADKPKWRKKGEVLSSVWECIGLRAQTSDLNEITKLLEDEAIDSKLAMVLSNCIGNILDMTDDLEEKKRIGDDVFDKLPAKYRGDVIDSLAKSCSPKALSFYKGEMNDSGIWEKKGRSRLSKAMQFFSFYGEDSILEYLLELKEQVGDDERKLHMVETAIQGVVAQNRERTDEEVQNMLGLVFDKLNEDTSAWDEINNKTDPAGVDFVGESSPEYASLMERKKAIEACRKQKRQLIRSLSGLRDYKWVTNILEKYASDPDTDISIEASQGLEKVKKNTADYAALKAKYNSRDKD